MKREERIQLNNLSKLVYGTSSKWQKMMEKGEVADLTRTKEDGTTEKYRGISRYSLEEVKRIMEETWQEELENRAKELKMKEVEIKEESLGSVPEVAIMNKGEVEAYSKLFNKEEVPNE